MAMSTVLGCIKQADIDYNLIQDGDRIAIGISGGKDSMVLALAMSLYQRFSKKDYQIVAIHITMGFDENNFEEVESFFKEKGIEYHVVPSKPMIYEVLKRNLTNNGKLPCSICSKMKKAAINQAAIKYSCNKVAFAHHVDDAIETLFLNEIYGGRIATFMPSTYLSNTNLTLIRPLIYCREQIIKKTINSSKIPVSESTCPNDKNTEREVIKTMLKDIYKSHPEAKQNFLNMLSNESKMELWHIENNEDE